MDYSLKRKHCVSKSRTARDCHHYHCYYHYCHYLVIELLTYYRYQPITQYTSVQDDGALPKTVDLHIARGP